MKTYAYRFMNDNCLSETHQEGIFHANGTAPAKRTAQQICRKDVLPNEVIGDWTDWTENGRIYACLFFNAELGRNTLRLIISEVEGNAITAGAFHVETKNTQTAVDNTRVLC